MGTGCYVQLCNNTLTGSTATLTFHVRNDSSPLHSTTVYPITLKPDTLFCRLFHAVPRTVSFNGNAGLNPSLNTVNNSGFVGWSRAGTALLEYVTVELVLWQRPTCSKENGKAKLLGNASLNVLLILLLRNYWFLLALLLLGSLLLLDSLVTVFLPPPFEEALAAGASLPVFCFPNAFPGTATTAIVFRLLRLR